MTLDDWLSPLSISKLHDEFHSLPHRKVHLLTAAILRRVWDDLPTHHTRLSVEATEKFADQQVTIEQLARTRSMDLLESCESLWLGPDAGYDEQLIGQGCIGCSICDARAAEYECSTAKSGYVLHGVRRAIEEPAWIVAQALLRAREIAGWKTMRDSGEEAEREEGRAQYAIFHEIVGPRYTDTRWPRWRTTDVRAIARGIHRTRAFDQLPILADALQDAGCDAENVLRHCREENEHVRGCWVVDLAMGAAERGALHHLALLQPQRLRYRARKFAQFVRYKQ